MSVKLETLPKIGFLRMGETIIEKNCSGDGLPIYSADKSNEPWARSNHFRRKNERGSIVIGARGTIGYPRLPKDELFGATQTTIVFSPDKARFVPEYLHYCLQQVDFENLGAQQAIPMLTISNLENLTVRSFKKPEQTKIAEILSTVDQAIEQTEALIAKQQRIKTGLMQDLLTRGIDENGNLRSEETHKFKDSPLGRIPVEWEVKAIGALASQITKGESPSWQGFKYQEEGVPFITSENVRAGFLDIAKSEKFISDTFHKKLKRSALRYGDILVNLVGASIARSAVYDLDRDANINQAVCSVRLSNEVQPLWLCEYLQLSESIERLLGEQVETARANLSLGDIRNYLVSYPPSTEQSEAIMQINLLRDKYESQLGSLTKLRSLKTGLMQDLLTGKVSVTPLLADTERSTGSD